MCTCLLSDKARRTVSLRHIFTASLPLTLSWIVTMSGWLTHCHALIMRACASGSCSTAVAPCLTGRHCGAIVIWNILYLSCGGDTRLLIAQTPSLFCLSPLPAPRERDCSGERSCLLSSPDHTKVESSTEQAISRL